MDMLSDPDPKIADFITTTTANLTASAPSIPVAASAAALSVATAAPSVPVAASAAALALAAAALALATVALSEPTSAAATALAALAASARRLWCMDHLCSGLVARCCGLELTGEQSHPLVHA